MFTEPVLFFWSNGNFFLDFWDLHFLLNVSLAVLCRGGRVGGERGGGGGGKEIPFYAPHTLNPTPISTASICMSVLDFLIIHSSTVIRHNTLLHQLTLISLQSVSSSLLFTYLKSQALARLQSFSPYPVLRLFSLFFLATVKFL